eukprot:TRINITY_DN18097_c0_g1_i2.p1 TRINITY_DN18097_c0_g1~~TRINITY_DN18097_c0_g1_i2.p1  ORF type:complete len:100 (+),score=11.32 TRINITY_DN18097_c0_g1_i2:64-363(+)
MYACRGTPPAYKPVGSMQRHVTCKKFGARVQRGSEQHDAWQVLAGAHAEARAELVEHRHSDARKGGVLGCRRCCRYAQVLVNLLVGGAAQRGSIAMINS